MKLLFRKTKPEKSLFLIEVSDFFAEISLDQSTAIFCGRLFEKNEQA